MVLMLLLARLSHVNKLTSYNNNIKDHDIILKENVPSALRS